MTNDERAKRLVGDMPWVTEHLTPAQLADFPKQIESCLDAAVQDALESVLCPEIPLAERNFTASK